MVVKKDNHEANKRVYHMFLREMQQDIHIEILQGKDKSLERHGYSKEEIKYLGYEVNKHGDPNMPPYKLVLDWYVLHLMKGTINFRNPYGGATEAPWDGVDPSCPKDKEGDK